ncbi:MAG: HTTM domain-containing protein [Nannocystaceae bacterium]|nr:HTTM domain-containing protein [Nannocystaceae bacterium]
MAGRMLDRMFEPVDAASMVAIRVLFGVLMALGVVRFWAMGWIEALYVTPKFYFSYWGLSWIKPLPQPGMSLVFGVMLVASILIALGKWYRVAAIAFFVAFTYVELVDQTNYLNHYYLVSLAALMLVCMPLAGRPSTVPRWTIWTLRLQLGLVYTFAGLAKLNVDWLFAGQPLMIWLEARQGIPIVGPLLAWDVIAHVMSWAGAAFDLSIFAALSWSRTRPLAYLAVIGFHVMTWLLFPIGIFPWVMIALTTVFFPPDWPRRWLPARALNRVLSTPGPSDSPRHERLVLAVLGVYFAVQLIVPLRHLAYPGSDHWHMQAFRFSWKVMLVEKTGMVEFRVVDPTSGRRWVVAPNEELTRTQTQMMSMQPDMILSYAHHIARRMAAQGYRDVAVYADAWASLNGRPSQRLIDPDTDLAAVRDGFANKAWIVAERPRP